MGGRGSEDPGEAPELGWALWEAVTSREATDVALAGKGKTPVAGPRAGVSQQPRRKGRGLNRDS